MFSDGTVHLSLCVADLGKACDFYETVFGVTPIYSSNETAHYGLFASHLVLRELPGYRHETTEVDDEGWRVPVPHIGFIVSRSEWDAIRDRVDSSSAEVMLEPVRRREATPAEHEVFFVQDPAGHALEIKTYLRNSG